MRVAFTAGSALAVGGIMAAIAAPTSPPPGGGAYLPITQSPSPQTIPGTLTVNGGLNVTGGSGICINGSCKTSFAGGAVNAATTGVVSGSTSINNCYAQYYSSYNYNGSNYNYYCDMPFTITLPFSQTTVSAIAPSATCTGPNYNNNYGGYSAYQTLNVTASLASSGNDVLLSGTCREWNTTSYAYTPYGITASGSSAARYVY